MDQYNIELPADTAFVHFYELLEWIVDKTEPDAPLADPETQDREQLRKKAESQVRRINVRNREFWDLKNAIFVGEIEAWSKYRVPTITVDRETMISVSDASKILAKHEIHLSLSA